MICLKCNAKVEFNTLAGERVWIKNNGQLCYYCGVKNDL